MTGRSRVVLEFVLLALTWGASFLFIKVGLQGLSPAQVVLGRLVAGAAVLAVLCLVSRTGLPREPIVWLHLSVVAALLCVAPFLLFAVAEQTVPSGLASVVNATTPLLTTLVALAALPEERSTRARVLGLLVGFVGVLVLLAPWRSGLAGDLPGRLACLAATTCYGAAFVYLRRFVTPRGLRALPVATVQVGVAAAMMLVAAPFVALQPVRLTPAVVAAVLALGVLGTGLAYVWNTDVVAAWGATNASTVTYLTPVVGVAAAVLVLHERLGWNEPVGAVIVLAGVALTQGRLRRGRRAPSAGGR